MLICSCKISLTGDSLSIEVYKTIYDCRPIDKRTPIEEKTYDSLSQLGIKFLRIDHTAANTIYDCHVIEKYLDVSICKNLFLTNNRKNIYCLLLLNSDKKFESGKISKQINSSRLSFASDSELMTYLAVSPGSVSILGLINDSNCSVTVAIDSDLLKNEYIGCHPCMNTSTLKIKTSDIIEKFIPYTNHDISIINM